MLTIAICDDIPDDMERIRAAAAAALPDAQLSLFSAPLALVEAAQKGFCPDLVVLDVRMEPMDGITLAKRICGLCPRCRIVFVSEYLGYATEVYDVRHSYFVLKSQLEKRMAPALIRAAEELEHLPRLSFRFRGQLQLVDAQSVLCLERALRKTYVYCLDGRYETSEHAQEILLRAKAPGFCQCHKSFWVNLSLVSAMNGDTFILDDGREIPISRSFRKAVRAQFFTSLHRDLEEAGL